MAGYHNYSKSNNAIMAEMNGEYPASKLAAVLKANHKELKGLTSADIKRVLQPSSWHHTSCKFNRTDYYYSDLEEEEIEKLANAIKIRKDVTKWIKEGSLPKKGDGYFMVKLFKDGQIIDWHPVFPDDYYSQINYQRISDTLKIGYARI